MLLTLEITEDAHSTKTCDSTHYTNANFLIQVHILKLRLIILFSLSDSCFGVVKFRKC